MSQNYIMSLDQGTTGSTALVLRLEDESTLDIISKVTIDFEQYFPESTWVEHDLDQIWASIEESAHLAIKIAEDEDPNFNVNKIDALGITNQRETLCAFDRKTSEPLRKAIVWQCKRSYDICKLLKDDGFELEVSKKTGLLLDPYFSASKLRWIMEEDSAVAAKLKSGQGVVGNIDTYLIHRLTKGESFYTEASNASRTLLYNLASGQWDNDLLKLFSVPNQDILPEIKDSAGYFGKTKGLSFLPDGIPITGVLGDQQAALAGQSCFDVGEAKCTYGTGAFLLFQTGDRISPSEHGLLTTVSWSLNGKRSYALEGSAFIAGASVQFLRDKLGMIKSAHESGTLATGVLASPEIYFVPALAGLGAPWWNPKAKGAFFGLTRGSTKEQMVRAVLEGMAFQVCDLLHAMEKDSSHKLKVLRVDGGACANDILMEQQAHLANLSVERPHNLETTALGAGIFAALGVGIFDQLEDLRGLRRVDKSFHPSKDPEQDKLRVKQLEGWRRAIHAAQAFADYKP